MCDPVTEPFFCVSDVHKSQSISKNLPLLAGHSPVTILIGGMKCIAVEEQGEPLLVGLSAASSKNDRNSKRFSPQRL